MRRDSVRMDKEQEAENEDRQQRITTTKSNNGRSESEISRHTNNWMHNHRLVLDPPRKEHRTRISFKNIHARPIRNEVAPPAAKINVEPELFCINREHEHFSKHTFPDCHDCKISSENQSSAGHRSQSCTVKIASTKVEQTE
mgnify:CR=1 FL=1